MDDTKRQFPVCCCFSWRPRVSVRTAITSLVVFCVLLASAPQIGTWYATANRATEAAAEHLLQSICSTSVVAFSGMAAEAEGYIASLASFTSRTWHTCGDERGELAGIWRNFLDLALIHPGWYVAAGDMYGYHAGGYGAAPQPAFNRSDPAFFFQDPDKYNGTFLAFYLEVNKTTQNWEIADYTGQVSYTYDSRKRPYYILAMANPGTPRWSSVYVTNPDKYQCISVSRTWAPLILNSTDANNSCGVVTVMVNLIEVSAFLRKHHVAKSDVWVVSLDDDELYIIGSSTTASMDRVDSAGNPGRMPMVLSEHKLTREVGHAVRSLRKEGKIGCLVKRTFSGTTYHLYMEDVDIRPGTGFPTVCVIVVVPISVYFAGIQRSIIFTIFMTLGIMLAAIAFSCLVSFLFSRPMISIMRQMERASDLDTLYSQISSQRRSPLITEIASIDSSLQKMWLLLGSFHKYVPMQVLRLMLRNGELARLHVDRHRCSILFCDIENFTPLTVQSDPVVLLQVFSEFMDICTTCIDEHCGLVDKLIGDCVMAFWGHPGEEKYTETNACFAALEILSRLERARARWKELSMPQLHCKIGIATGDVLVGNSGSSNHFHYTVLGSPVNLAARLEPLNKVMCTKALVCEETSKAISKHFLTRHVCRCMIRGFPEPQDIYELVATRDRALPSVIEATQFYNKAVEAIILGNNSMAVANLLAYLQFQPDDTFAQAQHDVLREERGFTDGVAKTLRSIHNPEGDGTRPILDFSGIL